MAAVVSNNSDEPHSHGIMSDLPLTKQQVKHVRKFRDLLGPMGGSAVTDAELIKFLLARKWDVQRALKLRTNYYELQSDLGWSFRTLDIEGYKTELEKEKMSVYGRDKRGAQIICFHAARHFPRETPLDVLLPYMMYWFEMVMEDVDTQVNGIFMLGDFTNFSIMQNFDVKAEKFFLSTIQDHFPARIRRVCIYNAPTAFSIVFKILKPFMKKKLRDKVSQVTLDDLYEFVDKSQLPMEFGGTFDYDYERFIAGLKPNLDAVYL